MSLIIAARFQLIDEANVARDRLVQLGCLADQISIFYVTPPGQHAAYPIGGDRARSPDRDDATSSNTDFDNTSIVAGASSSGVSRPEDTVKNKSKSIDPEVVRFRSAGILIAVAFDSVPSALLDRAVEELGELQGFDFEQTEGTITAGNWVDFDPVSLPQPLDERLALLCQIGHEVVTG